MYPEEPVKTLRRQIETGEPISSANLIEVLNFVEHGGDPPLEDEPENGSLVMSDEDLRVWDGFAQAGIAGYMSGTTIHDEPQIYARGIAQLAATMADEMMLERVERVESLNSFREAAARISAKIAVGVEKARADLDSENDERTCADD